MNKRFIIIYVCFILIGNIVAQNSQGFRIKIDSVETEIKSFLEKYEIPGAAVAIINNDSIWIGTYGFSDLKNKIPISNKTIFRLGSISKTYLAIAIMQLVNEGKISLNDPVKEIIPEIEIENKLEELHPVRVIHLLEHTSSIDDVHFNEGYNTSGIQDLALTEVFNKNPKSRYLRWKPGEYQSYSNDAYSLLGLIIERISGLKFEKYIQNNILDKIEATSTTYFRNDVNSSLFAQGYTSNGNALEFSPVLMRPSGGINSNIIDVSKFVQMLLHQGCYNSTCLVDSVSFNKMLYPTSSIPAQEGYKLGYGSGFSSHYVNGYKFFGHGGGLPDFNSIFLIKPECKLGVVILINSNSDYFGNLVKKIVLSIEFECQELITKTDFTTNKYNYREISGYYSQANYGISLDRFPNYLLTGLTVFERNDTLYCKEFGGEETLLVPISGNSYMRNEKSKESLYFFKNSDDKMMVTVMGKDIYIKDLAWKPIFERYFLMIELSIILSYLIFTIVWAIKRLFQKLRGIENLSITYLSRLLPLFAIISLLACVFSLSMWFSDYNNAGNISIKSISVFIFSLLFPVFSFLSLCRVAFKNEHGNKIEKVYLIIVSLTLMGLSLFLYKYEIIGLMLWSY
ncbi:MAG: beta-lactamase family protein [Candidatus Delongbacteria bacterium]|nr:beta-lactamase family protein [Candidatus Delongbacteria bacterium]MBN2835483.1 beta-lactamase family protein [Candidatus Delongbacteria bacterium]